MYLNTPTTDAAKSLLLINSLTETQNPSSSLPTFPNDIQTQLRELATSYSDMQLDLQNKREAFKIKNKAFRDLQAELRLLISHAFQAVKRRSKTTNLPTATIEAFGLLQDATQPKRLKQITEVVQVAARILTAHQSALDKGITVLIDPSPAEFTALMAATEEARLERAQALAEKEAAFRIIKDMRTQVAILIQQISTYTRMRYKGQPQESLRKAMLALGFQYKSTHKETNDSEDDADLDSGRDPEPEQPVDEGGETADNGAEDQAA